MLPLETTLLTTLVVVLVVTIIVIIVIFQVVIGPCKTAQEPEGGQVIALPSYIDARVGTRLDNGGSQLFVRFNTSADIDYIDYIDVTIKSTVDNNRSIASKYVYIEQVSKKEKILVPNLAMVSFLLDNSLDVDSANNLYTVFTVVPIDKARYRENSKTVQFAFNDSLGTMYQPCEYTWQCDVLVCNTVRHQCLPVDQDFFCGNVLDCQPHHGCINSLCKQEMHNVLQVGTVDAYPIFPVQAMFHVTFDEPFDSDVPTVDVHFDATHESLIDLVVLSTYNVSKSGFDLVVAPLRSPLWTVIDVVDPIDTSNGLISHRSFGNIVANVYNASFISIIDVETRQEFKPNSFVSIRPVTPVLVDCLQLLYSSKKHSVVAHVLDYKSIVFNYSGSAWETTVFHVPSLQTGDNTVKLLQTFEIALNDATLHNSLQTTIACVVWYVDNISGKHNVDVYYGTNTNGINDTTVFDVQHVIVDANVVYAVDCSSAIKQLAMGMHEPVDVPRTMLVIKTDSDLQVYRSVSSIAFAINGIILSRVAVETNIDNHYALKVSTALVDTLYRYIVAYHDRLYYYDFDDSNNMINSGQHALNELTIVYRFIDIVNIVQQNQTHVSFVTQDGRTLSIVFSEVPMNDIVSTHIVTNSVQSQLRSAFALKRHANQFDAYGADMYIIYTNNRLLHGKTSADAAKIRWQASL